MRENDAGLKLQAQTQRKNKKNDVVEKDGIKTMRQSTLPSLRVGKEGGKHSA